MDVVFFSSRRRHTRCGRDWSSDVCSSDLVGGQDEVVYDGGSFALGADRSLKAKLASFREQVATIEFRRNGGGWECQPGPIAPELSDIESIYQAMLLGLRD